MIDLSSMGKQLFGMLMQIPPDFKQIRSSLESGCYTNDDVNRVALQYVDECWGEYVWPNDISSNSAQNIGDYYWDEAKVRPNLHSTYLYEVIELLLDFGLNPCAEIDESNLMDRLPHVVNEYVSADTLALLFEHGADPQLKIRDGESVFSELNFEVTFAAIEQYDRRRYDALVHCWLVFIGYGARLVDGSLPIDFFIPHETDFPFKAEDFRNHRNYIFGLTHMKNRGENWLLNIFDKRTLWEVARL